MRWTNVRLIFLREFRDQLRDRRTLFTIAVLPLLLYPLLGITFMQVAQFMKEHPTRVWVVGGEQSDQSLIVDDKFANKYCPEREARLLDLVTDSQLPPKMAKALQRLAVLDNSKAGRAELDRLREVVQHELRDREVDALLYFPPGSAEHLERYRQSLQQRNDDQKEPASEARPGQLRIKIFVNLASDKSRIASNRVETILGRWREAIVHDSFVESNIPIAATQPFTVVNTDVAAEGSRQAAVWSKILPFIVLVWALTGAFYPAIDLCAGEKERGTLETLLCSPALRSEIVCGKLMTVILFSFATALLNLISMGATGLLVFRQLGAMAGTSLSFGPPPIASMGWIVLAIIPISALFGAMSLAIAAFARSSKEGQYYLMPLLLITLPLMMLPMLPGAELDLGTSLIPVTGMMLLLRSLVEGQYAEAIRFVIPVLAVTFTCCFLAIRWAANQFNNESVLFCESERWGLGLWVRHLVRDRAATPTFGEAMLCGVVLLVIQFFARLNVSMPNSWHDFFTTMFVTQVAFIATPVLIMAIILTRSPRKTLLLKMPRFATIPIAIALALLLHPTMMAMAHGIQWLYPLSDDMRGVLEQVSLMILEQPLIYVLLVMAVLPAICEELAFRGFMLSGFRKIGRKWTAIVLSSVFFGVTHGLLQQSIAACVLGIVLGYIAIQTGSLIPGILFHMTYNSLSLVSQRITPELVAEYRILDLIYSGVGTNEFGYQLPVIVATGLLSLLLLAWWFRRLPQIGLEPDPLPPALQAVQAATE